MVLALLLVMTLYSAAARAELRLFIGKDTLNETQTHALAKMLETQLQDAVAWDRQQGEAGFSKRMLDGDAPHLAILHADEIVQWAEAGMLTPLDGLMEDLDTVDETIIGACVTDERLFAIPLGMRQHTMAVDPSWLEKIRMGYLMDERMYPAWNYAQVLQLLDELALKGDAGLEIWPPEEEHVLCVEALLQGVCGSWFEDGATEAASVNLERMTDGFVWLEEMVEAGLIDVTESRDAALESFIGGETAIFIDWTPEESRRYAEALEAGSIRLLPYPSVSGIPFGAAQVICLIVPACGDEEAAQQARRAAALLGSGGYAQRILGEALHGTQETQWVISMSTLKGGATLRALFAQAIAEILWEDMPAKEAAQRIGRAMQVIVR